MSRSKVETFDHRGLAFDQATGCLVKIIMML